MKRSIEEEESSNQERATLIWEIHFSEFVEHNLVSATHSDEDTVSGGLGGGI